MTTAMTAFIYPENDWTAAEAVMKIQALAASLDYPVYSIPKDFSIPKEVNEMDTNDILPMILAIHNTVYAIFIAVDASEIDEYTQVELQMLSLSKASKRIYCLVPYGFKLKLENIKNAKVYRFNREDLNSIIKVLRQMINDIEQEKPAKLILSELLSPLLLLFLLMHFWAQNQAKILANE